MIDITTIREAMDGMADARPAMPFLVSPETGRSIDFAELRQQAIVLAKMLRQAELERGDKVAFLLDNGLLTAQLFLGAMYGGYVAVPLNVRAGLAQLSYMLDHCDARLVFVEDQYVALLRDALEGVRREIRVIAVHVDGSLPAFEEVADGPPPEPPAAEDVALLMYSSGSTGKPKGALHTHHSVLAHGANSIASHQLSAADRSLLVLPLYHINAECVTLIPTLLSGGSVLVAHRFVVSKFWDWVDNYHVTWSALVPTIISELVDWDDPGKDGRQAAFQRIRFLRSSSAPLSPTLHRQFLDKFQLPLLQAMGSTECGNVFSNPQPPAQNKIGSPGLPWGFQTRIVDRNDADVAPGESGEVLLRGPALMQGYYKDAEGTAAVVDSQGWLHTGDLARQDEDGYFFIVGRSKELIIKGGVNIAPRQIDDVLESHPAVLEAAAVGIPDRYFGEDAVAFVVLRSGAAAGEKELLAFCESRLGHFKTPSRIHFLKELPKGPSGKVQRLRLLDPAVLEAVAATTQPQSEAVTVDGGGNGFDSQTAGTSVEQIIASAWAEVLSVPQVDPQTNFFALGGHSLLAIQCLSKLRAKLPMVLSLADFFENPTIAEQAAIVRQRLRRGRGTDAQPCADESANWEQTLLQQCVPAAEETVIPRQNPADPYPLSPGQQGLWFLERLNPDIPVYNEAEAVRLTGELNVDALERAMNAVIDRHEVLRSTVRIIDEVPHAVTHASWPLSFKKIDLSARPEPEREAEVSRLLIAEPRIPYHLEAEPGIRVTLLRLSEHEHVLILMMHHIIADWTSEGIIWRDLSAAYRAILNGEPVALAPVSIQHGDYALWQQQRLATTDFGDDLAFWEEKLRGAPALLELPADRPRPRIMSYQGNRIRFKLSSALTEALRNTSRCEKTSLFTIFAAALDTLLYRYSGSDDILLGIPLADRDFPEFQMVVGYLLRVHVLRAPLTGEMTFRELLSRVQKATLDLYLHRAVPFDQVVQKLQPERSLSYTPLFQVMLNWRDRDQMLSFIGLEELAIDSLLSSAATAKFDLNFQVTDLGDEIWLELEYSTDLFDRDRMVRMLGHYQTLLDSIAADTGTRLAELPLLTADERQQLLFEWNKTAADYPKEISLAQLVEDQVARTPGAIAVACGEQQLTYRHLNARANQLAHELRKHGGGPGVTVGLYADRSANLIVALLAIVKSGAAYLPLDPLFPRERLHYMLEDSGARLLITERGLLYHLPTFSGTTVILEDETGCSNPSSNLNISVGPEQLAYLIYTSGSTGRPKGVQVPRGALNNFLWSMREWLQLNEHDRLLAVTTISFDIAGLEIWLPLLVGAQIVVARRESVADGVALRNLLDTHDITFLQATPVTWQLLFEAGWPGKPNLQAACGGESIPPEVAARLASKVARAWNLYGPTETTIWSTAYRLTDGQPPIPIGRPLANTQIYILDGQGQPVPIGVAGELYIGGDGLAHGYLNRPELTAEKFVPNPFCGHEARMYRTGDLARYRADGNIECLGRLDHQVKVHGYRIELGEIEEMLKTQQGIKQAVVVAREDTPGDKRLVAYLVADFAGQQAGSGISEENTQQWKTLWDITYSSAPPSDNHDPSLAGWNSSYTREAIPAEAMYEQVAFTVERLLSLKPQRVLEIGCGTGLLLLKIAPHCLKYVGMDFSQTVLEVLREQLVHEKLDHVELLERQADQLDDFTAGSFDLVVLNSIAQYFPSVDYLVDLLDKVIPLVAPRGTIQLGDLRNLTLLEACHLSAQDFHSHGTMPVQEFAKQIQHRISHEKELLIHPSLFQALKRRYPRLGHVTLQLKRGRDQNELTRFRYDAFLHLDAALSPETVTAVEWSAGNHSLSTVAELLTNGQRDTLRIANVPNARVIEYVSALRLLNSVPHQTVDALRSKARKTSAEKIDPEDLWALAERLGYEAEISWSTDPGKEVYYNVVFRRGSLPLLPLPAGSFSTSLQRLPVGIYGNNPLNNKLTASLIAQIREHLKTHLPDYMVPAAYVRLEALPVSPNGKLDRKALPAPEADAFSTRSYEAPDNEAETKAAEIWQEVLGIATVGRDDNFFDLGGDSLRLMKVHSRLQQAFGKQITVMDLFRYTTVRALAQHLAGDEDSQLSEILQVSSEMRRDAKLRRRQLRQEAAEQALKGAN